MSNLLNSAWRAGYADFERGADNRAYWEDMFGAEIADEYDCGRSAARDDCEARID